MEDTNLIVTLKLYLDISLCPSCDQPPQASQAAAGQTHKMNEMDSLVWDFVNLGQKRGQRLSFLVHFFKPCFRRSF